MATWQCINNCGACCQLKPDERPELADYLTPEELEQYLSMVGEDGWCINFDAESRRCTIYDHRPQFCRVQPDTFQRMFGIEPNELNEFAIDCCHQQIASIYGSASAEMKRFDTAIECEEGVLIDLTPDSDVTPNATSDATVEAESS